MTNTDKDLVEIIKDMIIAHDMSRTAFCDASDWDDNFQKLADKGLELAKQHQPSGYSWPANPDGTPLSRNDILAMIGIEQPSGDDVERVARAMRELEKGGLFDSCYESLAKAAISAMGDVRKDSAAHSTPVPVEVLETPSSTIIHHEAKDSHCPSVFSAPEHFSDCKTNGYDTPEGVKYAPESGCDCKPKNWDQPVKLSERDLNPSEIPNSCPTTQAERPVDADFPMGAIENGRTMIDRIDNGNDGCVNWEFGELKRCFEYMAEYLLRHPTDKDRAFLEEVREYIKMIPILVWSDKFINADRKLDAIDDITERLIALIDARLDTGE